MKRSGRWSLLLISSLLSLVVLEGLVRLTLPRFDPARQIRLYQGDGGAVLAAPGDGYQRHGEGERDVLVTINRHGFRDTRDLTRSRPGDLFVVGDSFTLGWALAEEDRFSNLLDDYLEERVYNIAMPVDVTGYERLVAHAQDRGGRVKRLVIGLCMENDLRSYASGAPTAGGAGGARRGSRLHHLKRALARRVALYGALAQTVHNLPSLRRWARRAGLLEDQSDLLDRRTFVRQEIDGTTAALRGLIERRGISEAVILLIPSRALWVGDNRASERRIHDALVRALAREGLTTVDLRPSFEATGDPLGLHFRGDWHWNEAGHRMAAAVLLAHWTLPATAPAAAPTPATH